MSDPNTPATPAEQHPGGLAEPVKPAEVTLTPGETVIKAEAVKTYDEEYVTGLRTEAQKAKDAADAKIKDALKALGISDETEDPLKAAQDAAANTAKERDTARATARDTSAELIVWRHDRRRARLHPDPYAGLADDEQISTDDVVTLVRAVLALGPKARVPNIVVAPGRVSAFSSAVVTKSRCSAALIRVVSAFQNRMSKAGGVRPAR